MDIWAGKAKDFEHFTFCTFLFLQRNENFSIGWLGKMDGLDEPLNILDGWSSKIYDNRQLLFVINRRIAMFSVFYKFRAWQEVEYISLFHSHNETKK